MVLMLVLADVGGGAVYVIVESSESTSSTSVTLTDCNMFGNAAGELMCT